MVGYRKVNHWFVRLPTNLSGVTHWLVIRVFEVAQTRSESCAIILVGLCTKGKDDK